MAIKKEDGIICYHGRSMSHYFFKTGKTPLKDNPEKTKEWVIQTFSICISQNYQTGKGKWVKCIYSGRSLIDPNIKKIDIVGKLDTYSYMSKKTGQMIYDTQIRVSEFSQEAYKKSKEDVVPQSEDQPLEDIGQSDENILEEIGE